jgi:hypothetical protein
MLCETKTAPGKTKSTHPAHQTNKKTDPTITPKNLFTEANKKAPALTNQSDLTKITINGQLEIVRVADGTGTIDGMSTDDPQPGQDEEANNEIDHDAEKQSYSEADTSDSPATQSINNSQNSTPDPPSDRTTHPRSLRYPAVATTALIPNKPTTPSMILTKSPTPMPKSPKSQHKISPPQPHQQ